MQNLVFKGLNGQFKIVAATQYITRIKDSIKKPLLLTKDGNFRHEQKYNGDDNGNSQSVGR